MTAHNLTLKAEDMAKDLVINVKVSGLKRFMFRLWLAKIFIKFGAFISRLKIVVDAD